MAKKKRTLSGYQRDRHSHWQGIILQWQSSGLSQAAFCRKNKLQYQQFSKWKIRLGKGDLKPKVQEQPKAQFIEFSPQVCQRTYEIITPGDYRIRIQGNYDPEVLSDLISIVSRSC